MLVALLGLSLLALWRWRRRKVSGSDQRAVPGQVPDSPVIPQVGDDATEPRDAAKRSVTEVALPENLGAPTGLAESAELSQVPLLERPDPVAGRLVRLRGRLARSNSALGQGLLNLLSGATITEQTWDELEAVLLAADVGVGPTEELLASLRSQVLVESVRDPQAVRGLLRSELLQLLDPDADRKLAVHSTGTVPAVVLVVGVNGTGKTTTVGKLARVLVAQDLDVLLGAADTFRAAAADQLQTWGARVGVPTVRADREGADPAAVAFDAVRAGQEAQVDVVLIDTAGRLQNKAGLMDELGKVKRVIEKQAPVAEVLLVLDATTGQNGLQQAKIFQEVVAITGIVLSKLDGTAKGGIVIAVQRELGVPVKLIGLGEGPDDLAPFQPEEFIDALLDSN